MTPEDYNRNQIDKGSLTVSHITELVRNWQARHGLVVDGQAGDIETIPSIQAHIKSKTLIQPPTIIATGDVDYINDPGEPTITFEEFSAQMLDLRKFHTPIIQQKIYSPAPRDWKTTRGITLHQTACDMGYRPERYYTIGCHFVVLRNGQILWMCDPNRIVYHGNGWNTQCVGIEINGLFAGLKGDNRTVWDDPTTQIRETGMDLPLVQEKATRYLIRWICIYVRRNSGKIEVLNAHRQSSLDRQNDPGEEIWSKCAVPLHQELKLTDGGIGFKIGGYAIPEKWDSRCKGIAY